MFDYFFPDRYIASTYVIDFEKLYEKGVRGLIFDIDNTLVPHGAPADKRAVELFARLKKIGFRCCLISNNQEPRVKMFNEKPKISMKPKVPIKDMGTATTGIKVARQLCNERNTTNTTRINASNNVLYTS